MHFNLQKVIAALAYVCVCTFCVFINYADYICTLLFIDWENQFYLYSLIHRLLKLKKYQGKCRKKTKILFLWNSVNFVES